ncbi:MAG: hypothetical protein ACJAR1_002480 [Rubritalea sp.]|jgi:hypothetical protein
MSDNPYQTPESDLGSNLRVSPCGAVRSLSFISHLSIGALALCLFFNSVSYSLSFSSDYSDYLNIQNSSGQMYSDYIYSAGLEYIMYLEWSYLLATILAAIVISIWTYRAMVNTWAVVKMKPTITPGWAVGWHFIPVANLWKPYEAMLDIWRGVFGLKKSQFFLLLWWMCWIFSMIIASFGSADSMIPNGLEREGTIAVILDSVAAILLMRIIFVITKGQQTSN